MQSAIKVSSRNEKYHSEFKDLISRHTLPLHISTCTNIRGR
jgi:hypothetical protein